MIGYAIIDSSNDVVSVPVSDGSNSRFFGFWAGATSDDVSGCDLKEQMDCSVASIWMKGKGYSLVDDPDV